MSEETEICCDCLGVADACHCGDTEHDAGRRIDEERNDRVGREINALAKLRSAGIDVATCGEEEAAAVVGPVMAATLCRQERRLRAMGYVPD